MRSFLPIIIAAICAACTAFPAQAQELRHLSRILDQSVGRVLALNASGDAFETGSGFAVATDGRNGEVIFVTNNHVVERADGLRIVYGTDDGREVFDAIVINRSAQYDMAVLRLSPLDGTTFRPRILPLGTFREAQGNDVFAIGFPGVSDILLNQSIGDPAFFEPTLNSGIVTKLFPGSWQPGGMSIDLVQHDAAINGGNSGGPLVTRCGVVVGLNTAKPLENGTSGTFWASSALPMADFLKTSGVTPRTSASTCGIFSPGGLWWRAHGLTLLGVALLLAAGGAALAYARPSARGRAGGPAPAHVRPMRHAKSGPALLTARIGNASFPLDKSKLESGVVIGRGDAAGIKVDHENLSRSHASLQLVDRRLMLADLDSTNGTTVDDTSLRSQVPVQINTDSRVAFGGLTMTLTRDGGA